MSFEATVVARTLEAPAPLEASAATLEEPMISAAGTRIRNKPRKRPNAVELAVADIGASMEICCVIGTFFLDEIAASLTALTTSYNADSQILDERTATLARGKFWYRD
jgi:hypothetical protein